MSETIAIIGAGMAGLTAARILSHRGARIAVFEKSRGIGGRLSTRATIEFLHGAELSNCFAPDVIRFVSLERAIQSPARICSHFDFSTEHSSTVKSRMLHHGRLSGIDGNTCRRNFQ